MYNIVIILVYCFSMKCHITSCKANGLKF